MIGEVTFPSILRELDFQAEVLRRAVSQDLRYKDVGAGRTGSEVTLSPLLSSCGLEVVYI